MSSIVTPQVPPFLVANANRADRPIWTIFRTRLSPKGTPADPLSYELEASLLRPRQRQQVLSSGPLSLTAGTSSTTFAVAKSPSFDPLAWTEPGYRAKLLENFAGLLRAVEESEEKSLVPGAASFTRRLAASVLPATFDESLYFHHGLYRGTPASQRLSVDLSPGMRLRIEHATSQFVYPRADERPEESLTNGYVASGQSRYDLVETLTPEGAPTLAFDAFLGRNALTQVAANQGGAAGVIDLQIGGRRRYYRLCYPAQLPSSDSPGAVGPLQNVVLIGANKLALLDQATDAYYRPDTGDALAAVPEVVVHSFRGRALVVPEIPCRLNGELIYVPLGTTVRQLLQRALPLARLPGVTYGIEYYRLAPERVFFKNPNMVRYFMPVEFKPRESSADPSDAYDMPVIAGDDCRYPLGRD